MKAVVDIDNKILFIGNHDDCIEYMRNHEGWEDLRYLSGGRLGRLSSWIL